MFLLKKITRMYYVLMTIKEYNQSIQQKHMHMEQAKIYCEKKEETKFNNIIKQ